MCKTNLHYLTSIRMAHPVPMSAKTESPSLIDIGVNLTNKKFADDIPAVLDSAWEYYLESMILTGTTLQGSTTSLDIVKQYDNPQKLRLYSTAGIHPHYSSGYGYRAHQELTKLLKDPKVVAVGECGLDYNRMFCKKEIQLKCFHAHMKLAKECNKPLFLHERDAHDDFCEIIRNYQPAKMVVHCYTGNRKQAEEYVQLGAYIGITGWICDQRRNADLLDALKSIPVERLMIETDAPFLLPHYDPVTKITRNEPSYLSYVAKRLSQELQMPYDKLCEQLRINTKQFFQLP